MNEWTSRLGLLLAYKFESIDLVLLVLVGWSDAPETHLIKKLNEENQFNRLRVNR